LKGDTPGNADGCENTGVAGKAIREVAENKDDGRSKAKDNAPFEAQGKETQRAQSRRRDIRERVEGSRLEG
jgi:hypothetical protein